MRRLYLTLSDELYLNIEQQASESGMGPNLFAVSLLEKLYDKNDIDYPSILESVIASAKKYSKDKFILSELEDFQKVPSNLKLRIGRSFNDAVKKGKVEGVERATTIKNGEKILAFKDGSAVFRKTTDK